MAITSLSMVHTFLINVLIKLPENLLKKPKLYNLSVNLVGIHNFWTLIRKKNKTGHFDYNIASTRKWELHFKMLHIYYLTNELFSKFSETDLNALFVRQTIKVSSTFSLSAQWATSKSTAYLFQQLSATITLDSKSIVTFFKH